jgi:hypothetical protein
MGKDATSNNGVLCVCHASVSVVKYPDWQFRNNRVSVTTGKLRDPEKKDFGLRFYMCETRDQAYPISLYAGFDEREVARVILNEYTLDLAGLEPVLRLPINILWVMAVAAHRQRNSGSVAIRRRWKMLADALRLKVAEYKLVIAPISDDKFYELLDDFVDCKVSEYYTIETVNYMNYPLQYVSKSSEADERIEYVNYRELSDGERQTAKRKAKSADLEMRRVIAERRKAERAAVEAGEVRGRLFSDIVESCLSGVEDAVAEEQRTHLLGVVGGWLENGEC